MMNIFKLSIIYQILKNKNRTINNNGNVNAYF